MDNYQIAESFSLLAKLLDIHGENSFKTKSYASAAFAIENLTTPLSEIPTEKIASIKGIGASSAQKIIEILQTGQLKTLDEIIFRTPPGVTEMLNIKGIGPKKINMIWKEMEIESIGELLYACKENRLKLYKGFGEKTQQNVAGSIEFYLKSKGSFLYAQVENFAAATLDLLQKIFVQKKVEITGAYKRQLEIINELEYVLEATENEIEIALANIDGFQFSEKAQECIVYKTAAGVRVKLYPASPGKFMEVLIRTSSSPEFFNSLVQQHPLLIETTVAEDEESWFTAAGINFIPGPRRELPEMVELSKKASPGTRIEPVDIKGIIHCHSNWSDGSNTIEEMAMAAIGKGLEYMVISDHSKSAFYAQGLQEQKIKEQHLYVDELNSRLSPFRIFKSIESDILNDGSLDYSNDILATFDMVIASVHSNLKMTEEKAMARLLTAIANPYTTILGHMTGRLLLSRPGYPVDHEKIIEACAANNVVIELNAHPNRLDIDWRFIDKALAKSVMVSIDPDAHHIDGLDDTRYGVLVAQKSLLTKESNLSSFSLAAFEDYLLQRKKLKNI
jgi:DNA polymerase (family 10)